MPDYYDIAKEIVKVHIDPNAKPMKLMKTPAGNLYVKGEMLREKRCTCILEDFAPGSTFTWTFSFDEFHYIVYGKAEVTYTLIYDLYNKEQKMTIQQGDAYCIPIGARVTWKTDKSGPLGKMCVMMPGQPGRQIPPEASGVVDKY